MGSMIYLYFILFLSCSNSNRQHFKVSPSFVQVNQQVIINIHYLTLIDGKNCVFDPPFDRGRDVQISRYYFKKLQDKFNFM